MKGSHNNCMTTLSTGIPMGYPLTLLSNSKVAKCQLKPYFSLPIHSTLVSISYPPHNSQKCPAIWPPRIWQWLWHLIAGVLGRAVFLLQRRWIPTSYTWEFIFIHHHPFFIFGPIVRGALHWREVWIQAWSASSTSQVIWMVKGSH